MWLKNKVVIILWPVNGHIILSITALDKGRTIKRFVVCWLITYKMDVRMRVWRKMPNVFL